MSDVTKYFSPDEDFDESFQIMGRKDIANIQSPSLKQGNSKGRSPIGEFSLTFKRKLQSDAIKRPPFTEIQLGMNVPISMKMVTGSPKMDHDDALSGIVSKMMKLSLNDICETSQYSVEQKFLKAIDPPKSESVFKKANVQEFVGDDMMTKSVFKQTPKAKWVNTETGETAVGKFGYAESKSGKASAMMPLSIPPTSKFAGSTKRFSEPINHKQAASQLNPSLTLKAPNPVKTYSVQELLDDDDNMTGSHVFETTPMSTSAMGKVATVKTNFVKNAVRKFENIERKGEKALITPPLSMPLKSTGPNSTKGFSINPRQSGTTSQLKSSLTSTAPNPVKRYSKPFTSSSVSSGIGNPIKNIKGKKPITSLPSRSTSTSASSSPVLATKKQVSTVHGRFSKAVVDGNRILKKKSTANKPFEHQCVYCSKTFTLFNALQNHLLENCEKIPPRDKRKLYISTDKTPEKKNLIENRINAIDERILQKLNSKSKSLQAIPEVIPDNDTRVNQIFEDEKGLWQIAKMHESHKNFNDALEMLRDANKLLDISKLSVSDNVKNQIINEADETIYWDAECEQQF